MPDPFVAVVCGGGSIPDTPALRRALARELEGAVVVFRSDMSGFDHVALKVAKSMGIPVTTVGTLRDREGKRCNERRSHRMLHMSRWWSKEMSVGLRVIVGPGGQMTDDMIKRSRKIGIEVKTILRMGDP